MTHTASPRRKVRQARFLARVFLLASFSLAVGAKEAETDLNGFRLLQFPSVVEATFGPPVHTADAGDSVVKAYTIDKDAYMAVGHPKAYPNSITMLQVTGATERALPFRGLRLGDPEEKVHSVLGPPSKRRKIQSPPVEQLNYSERNYSVQLDAKGRLYSILIFADESLGKLVDFEQDTWGDFKSAIKSKNISRIAEVLRPDVEIYRRGAVLSIGRRYSDFMKEPDEAILDALFGRSNSVLIELERSEPEEDVRFDTKMGIGRVFKFKRGTILREIAFFPYNGRYRAYEIAFRD